ncbi:MAG: formimidoylglutamate deiminase [Parvularculaceae bacterium]
MTVIFARRARLSNGWASNVSITVNDGRISEIIADSAPAQGAFHADTLLPALSNLHSHSFQRAMAGMTEYKSGGRDSFWTWRDLMYRFAQAIRPEEVEAIAALVFMEMLEAGYAAVGEFHYLHHQPGGAPYAALDELSQRIFAAAAQTGVGLTHLPVLYIYGGAGKKPPSAEQARFCNDVDRFNRLVETARGKLPLEDSAIGIAPHSLRATAPDDLAAALGAHPSGPVHIHIAEQPKEVDDIRAWLGARPVEWLLANAPVDRRWCAVHATHMTPGEAAALARSGAVAGLCPITEANLGDGPFIGPAYLEAGGAFGVGSDSNVRISLTEELRMLEYSQRLRDLSRNILTRDGAGVGETIYLGAARGGAQALGRNAGAIEAGRLADLVAMDTRTPALCALAESRLLDGLCFAADDRVVTDVWSAGRHVVKSGRHVVRDNVIARHETAIKSLTARL